MIPLNLDEIKSFKYLGFSESQFQYYGIQDKFIYRYSVIKDKCKWYECPNGYAFDEFKESIVFSKEFIDYIQQYITITTFEKVLKKASEETKRDLLFHLNLFT